jgi:hypothetical protein
MKTNPLKEGILTENFAGIGVVTREVGETPHRERAITNLFFLYETP